MSANPDLVYDHRRERWIEPEPPFMSFSDLDVESFISSLSRSDEPGKYLEDWGVCTKHDHDLIAMLVEMTVQWQRDSSTVSKAAGQHFWKLMRAAALEEWTYFQNQPKY
jgi:hypothetical protein